MHPHGTPSCLFIGKSSWYFRNYCKYHNHQSKAFHLGFPLQTFVSFITVLLLVVYFSVSREIQFKKKLSQTLKQRRDKYLLSDYQLTHYFILRQNSSFSDCPWWSSNWTLTEFDIQQTILNINIFVLSLCPGHMHVCACLHTDTHVWRPENDAIHFPLSLSTIPF